MNCNVPELFNSRICHCDSSCGELISPCYCSGSMRWVHQVCLQHWIRASNNKACELCRYPYSMMTKMKPPCYWESLPMSPSEKRRLFCSVIFHLIALGCVIWSLYVLIGKFYNNFFQFTKIHTQLYYIYK
jgi:E3 ubiquitin-protein ligase MARCH1/8